MYISGTPVDDICREGSPASLIKLCQVSGCGSWLTITIAFCRLMRSRNKSSHNSVHNYRCSWQQVFTTTSSSSSSSGGMSLAGHSCLHKFTPLGMVLRMLPCRVEAKVVMLEIELNRTKPGSSWSTTCYNNSYSQLQVKNIWSWKLPYFQHHACVSLNLCRRYLNTATCNIPVLLQMKNWTFWQGCWQCSWKLLSIQ